MKASGTSILITFLALASGGSALARHESADQFAALGDQRLSEGRFLEAIDQYSRAIKADKRNPHYYQVRAQAEISASKFKAAVADAGKAIKFVPEDPLGYELRSSANDNLKQYKKVKADLDKLLVLRPDNARYLMQRAEVGVDLKEMDGVIADCNQAIRLGLDRDQLAEVYRLRAIAYKKAGNKQQSQMEMNKYESLH
jgi:tetratricopeptide (TPR) repeat protein